MRTNTSFTLADTTQEISSDILAELIDDTNEIIENSDLYTEFLGILERTKGEI